MDVEQKPTSPFVYITIILIAILGYGIYTYQDLKQQYTNLTELSSKKITQLENIIDTQAAENENLNEALKSEIFRNQAFKEELTETVETFEKLSKTDEELLQKYSKVYFLNEHYEPSELTEIEPGYLYDEDEEQQIHAKIYPFLENMLRDAAQDDVTLWITSAYRSFDTQTSLKAGYKVTYGSGANTFSADQGYSEHQLGTAVDFTTEGMNGGLTEAFANTEAYEWLKENAFKYGFTLSYPENNEYYVFEPWHWRFVGKDLARQLHTNDKYFYDLPQREIDEYLLEIFD